MAKQGKFVAKKKQPPQTQTASEQKMHSAKFIAVLFDTLGEYKNNFNLYTKIALVVSIASAFYNLLQLNQNGNDGNLITGIISTYGAMAIIWTHFNLKSASRKKLSQIYNTVSAKFLRVAFGNILLGAASLPLLVFASFGLMAIASLNSIRLYLLPPFIIIFGLLLLFVIRYILTFPIIMKEDISAFKAFKKSAKLTKKIKLKLMATIIVFSMLVAGVYLLIMWLYSFSKAIAGNSVINTLTNAILLTVLIPPVSIFISRVYERQAE